MAAEGLDNPAELYKGDFVKRWADGIAETCKASNTTLKAAAKLGVDWDGPYNVFGVSPATIEKLLTLTQNSDSKFTEDLTPEPFHLSGTKLYKFHPSVTHSSLGKVGSLIFFLLVATLLYMMSGLVQIHCPTCRSVCQGAGWSPHLRRVCGMSRTHFLMYTRVKCNKCKSKAVYTRITPHVAFPQPLSTHFLRNMELCTPRDVAAVFPHHT